MPRRTNPVPSAPVAAPLRLQLYRQLRAAIEQGSFAPGARLPPSREHAATLGVSRNTMLWALQRYYARQESRFLELVWSKVSLIHAVDETDTAPYGVYYSKTKPLVGAALKNKVGI